MAAIQSRWGRWLIHGLSGLSILLLLIWLAAIALMLSQASDYAAELAARPAPSPDDRVLSGTVELSDPGRQGADDVAAPFGWVIGQTPCARVLAQVPDSSQDAPGKWVSVGGQGVAALGVPGMLRLAVGCNTEDIVERVLLRFYKDRNGLVRMQAMAHELDARYRVAQTPDPADQVKDGEGLFGAWRADNAVIRMTYHAMDRSFWLEYADPP
ncbi:hypothetical protein ACMHYJ_15630 [Castellaniella hirudinis]|uniref:hypothetical protein n=1 Tax=Castellaniella hirudinis TaxID=1144617 RepID=UPI0039C49A41